MKIDSVAVIGIGLIGGSVCRAVKKFEVAREVIGIDPDERVLRFAAAEGVVDKALVEPGGVIDSEVVVIATYVDTISDVVEKILPYLKEGCLITDVGSVKSAVVSGVSKVLNDKVFFIGSHPIAGKEHSGIKNSTPDLFNGKKVIVTPTNDSNEAALEKITDFWVSLGAEVVNLAPEFHDRIFAYVSHLPHLVAYSLVNSVSSANIDNIFSYSGGGLKDYTRISASSPEMWKTIFLQNKRYILESMEAFKINMKRLESAVKNEDIDELMQILENAENVQRTESAETKPFNQGCNDHE